MLHERDKGIALALNIKGLTLLTQLFIFINSIRICMFRKTEFEERANKLYESNKKEGKGWN